MLKQKSINSSEAEVIALNALTFLAGDAERLGHFLVTTGLDPQDLRRMAGNSLVLGGVLDYLLADQSLLLAFAGNEGISPESVMSARRRLPGARDDL